VARRYSQSDLREIFERGDREIPAEFLNALAQFALTGQQRLNDRDREYSYDYRGPFWGRIQLPADPAVCITRSPWYPFEVARLDYEDGAGALADLPGGVDNLSYAEPEILPVGDPRHLPDATDYNNPLAFNVAEWQFADSLQANGTHLLGGDTAIRVYEWWDDSTPPRHGYFFYREPPRTFVVTLQSYALPFAGAGAGNERYNCTLQHGRQSYISADQTYNDQDLSSGYVGTGGIVLLSTDYTAATFVPLDQEAAFDKGSITDNSAAPSHTVSTTENGNVSATEINGWTLLEGTAVFVWKKGGTWYFDGAYSDHGELGAEYTFDETAGDSWDVESQAAGDTGVVAYTYRPVQDNLVNDATLDIHRTGWTVDGRGNVVALSNTTYHDSISFYHHIEDADWHNVEAGPAEDGSILWFDDATTEWQFLDPPSEYKWLSWNQSAWVFGYPDHDFFTPVPDPRPADSADPHHTNVDDTNVDTSASGVIVLRDTGTGGARTWEFLSTSGATDGHVLTVQNDESLDWEEAASGDATKYVKVTGDGGTATPDVTEIDETGDTTGGTVHNDVETLHQMTTPTDTYGMLIDDKDGNPVFIPMDFI
jgi:hypothetical protein